MSSTLTGLPCKECHERQKWCAFNGEIITLLTQLQTKCSSGTRTRVGCLGLQRLWAWVKRNTLYIDSLSRTASCLQAKPQAVVSF